MSTIYDTKWMCCLFEGFENDIKALVKEALFKDPTHPLDWMNELQDWHQSQEKESM
ncbi:hypothetical protein PISMIDRAFT_17364 [Pisolithus microcarpus 441]|uniref:Uncharacterized protein n=1 Tax=Pisolithus microcarpus 441 TaxID=765257 RepID=A0A0C9YKD6_9AGAM|nr:hypothetical protein PISMIDRAFT_17364 [Pisolithus microcarpus 441]